MTGEQTENEPREECGVFGVWAPGEEVAKLTYYGLYALQHRGQEAAGIAVADGVAGRRVQGPRPGQPGLRRADAGRDCEGHVAVGHCRYSTTGSTTWENAQPTFRTTAAGTGIALGHNGNLVNTAELAAPRPRSRSSATRGALAATTDSDILGALLAHGAADSHRRRAGRNGAAADAARRVLPDLLDEHTLYAARDPHGVRPLCARPAGPRLGGRFARPPRSTSSVRRSSARSSRASCWRSTPTALRSTRFANPDPKGCVFEYVYLARPDTTIAGRRCTRPGSRSAAAGPGEAGRGRPGDPGAGVRHSRRDRLRPGVRHPLRPGPGEERLCRADVHPAVADHPAARHSAQAQPAPRRDPRQAADRRRRLDRARQHPAGAGPDAARGRRGRGARADRLAAGAVAVLLRHRLRHPGRADRQRRSTGTRCSRPCAMRSAPTPWATSRRRA